MKRPVNYLFVTIDGGGNIPAMLGLAKRLHANGDHIRVLTEPCLESPVRSNGLDFIPFREYFTRTDRKEDICKDWNDSPLKQPSSFRNIIFGPAEIVVKETIEALENHPTDVLVVDCLLLPALIGGEFLDIPRVVIFHMMEYLPGPNRPPGVMGLLPGNGFWGKTRDRLLGKVFYAVLNKNLPKINAIRQKLHIAPLNDMIELIHQADRRFIQTLEQFDFPIVPRPENVRYTGPILDDPDWVNPWQNPWPADDKRPLVVVSFSSTYQNQVSILKEAIFAAGALDVRCLVTTGFAVNLDGVTLPENTKVIESAPHSEVFPLAALVITHAGHGTIMRSLAHGVPMICLPMGRDQNDNAVKVAFHGCGIALPKHSKATTIRKAMMKVLTNNSYKASASSLQGAIREAAAKNTAVRELENLVVDKSTLIAV